MDKKQVAQPKPLTIGETFLSRFLEGCVRGLCDVFIETVPALSLVLRYVKLLAPQVVGKIFIRRTPATN